MYKVKSLAKYEVNNQSVFVINSPVRAERNFNALIAAIGKKIEIDREEYIPIGFEMRMPSTPVTMGEKIIIMVKDK